MWFYRPVSMKAPENALLVKGNYARAHSSVVVAAWPASWSATRCHRTHSDSLLCKRVITPSPSGLAPDFRMR